MLGARDDLPAVFSRLKFVIVDRISEIGRAVPEVTARGCDDAAASIVNRCGA